ncbi:MAG: hypothetical protein JXB49_28435 [Bacteroidales bacterium]|nr:hypothetical protein [Bacteroidales bacterium]
MLKLILKISGMLMSVFILLHSCYYDSEEYLFPELNNSCDTLDITYSGTIQPMLQSNCYVCHSNSNAAGLGGNIRLEDYEDVKTVADDGRLYGSIAHESGFSPMPRGGSQLNDCIIQQTKIWIDNGAPNNKHFRQVKNICFNHISKSVYNY